MKESIQYITFNTVDNNMAEFVVSLAYSLYTVLTSMSDKNKLTVL